MTNKRDTSTVVAVVSAKPFMDALAHCQRVVLDPRKRKERHFHDALYVAHIAGSENEQTVRVEATDGVRLFSTLLTAAMVIDFETFIDGRALPAIRSSLSRVRGDLTLDLKPLKGPAHALSMRHGDTCAFASWGKTLTAKTLTWPNTALVDPRRMYQGSWVHRMPNRITVLRKELINACAKAVKAKSESIYLKSDFGRVTVIWTDQQEQDGFRGIELRTTAGEYEHCDEQCFDPRFLRDALSTGGQTDSITIYCPVTRKSGACVIGDTVLMALHGAVRPHGDKEQKGA